MAEWCVYIIRCENGDLYTGITTDVERRFSEHASGRGAKFFHRSPPQDVVYREICMDRAAASRREAAIKKLSRQAKLDLIAAT